MEGTARREVAAPTCGTERRRGRWAQNVGAHVVTIAFLGRQKRPGRCLLQRSHAMDAPVSARLEPHGEVLPDASWRRVGGARRVWKADPRKVHRSRSD